MLMGFAALVAIIGRREKEGQSRFFRQVLQHPISQQFPPAEDYTLRVLRLYYAAIDELYLEYDEEMIDLYTSLLERRTPSLTQTAGHSPPPPPGSSHAIARS
jgi:hypothetical protein